MMPTKTKVYPRGNELLKAVVNKIITKPKQWDQNFYHCGTKHCVAGWAQILDGKKHRDYPGVEAQNLLNLTNDESIRIFSCQALFRDIYAFACRRLKLKMPKIDNDNPKDYPLLK